MGADLSAVNSTRFRPKNAFITNIDSPSSKNNIVNKS